MIRGLLSTAAGLILVMQASTANAASIVTEWLDQALPYAQEVAWEPTVGSRFLATLHTAMYDAWTAYDPTAVGVVAGTTLKGQGGPNNEANKREAISHAAFTVLRVLAPQHRHALIEQMQALGYDPNADTPPAIVGRRAAAAVLANCRDDGANEVGNFADTTGYKPRMSGDRKSTRLNPSHEWISYAVFCLKKKKKNRPNLNTQTKLHEIIFNNNITTNT